MQFLKIFVQIIFSGRNILFPSVIFIGVKWKRNFLCATSVYFWRSAFQKRNLISNTYETAWHSMLPEAWVLHRLSTWHSRHVWRNVSSHLALASFPLWLTHGNPNRPATVGSRQPASSGWFRERFILVQGPCVMGFCLDAWIAKDDIKKGFDFRAISALFF